MQGLSVARVVVSMGFLFAYGEETTDAVGGLSPIVEVFAEGLNMLLLKQITRV